MWIIFTILLVVLASAAWAGISAAPWVPTKAPDLERIHQLLSLTPNDKFIELGAGNGRVSRHLAKRTKANVEGVELSLLPWFSALFQNRFSGSRARVRLGSLYKIPLQEKTAVYMFLMPEIYKKLRPKLESELPHGARVVSYVWPIEGWTPERVDRNEKKNDLFLYVIKKQ